MKNTNKKRGFTLIELVVVVAVIAILTAVLVPTFAGIINKANRSVDEQMVAQMNTILAADEAADGKPATPSEAVKTLEENGYRVDNLSAKSKDYEMIWNSETNRIVLLNKGTEEVVIGELAEPTENNWKFAASVDATDGYSYYLTDDFKASSVTVAAGLDVGNNANISVALSTDEAVSVVIRTIGDGSVLTVDAPNADVDFYGYAGNVTVDAVKSSSLHIWGSVNALKVVSGHVKVEDIGTVFEITSIATGATVDNAGYIAKAPEGATIGGDEVGGDYEINSLARLEAFRDAVNSGNSFEGLKVTLTADITLNDGWTPIGEGSRKTVKGASKSATLQFSGNAFRGEFDGGNHIIYNLNNKGFVPTGSRLGDDDGVDVYAYGFFGLVASGAEIKNVTFKNVDIDTTAYTAALGDSVAACVGFSAGSLTIDNVKVYGTIIAADSVGGVVGRAYKQDVAAYDSVEKIVTVTNCENFASILVDAYTGKAAGIVGYVQGVAKIVINNNVNNGKIESKGAQGSVAGVVLYGTSNVEAKENVNNGNLYLPSTSLELDTAHGFGLVGAPATGGVYVTTGVENNVNNGKFYIDGVAVNDLQDTFRIFAGNGMYDGGTGNVTEYEDMIEANVVVTPAE